MDLGSYRSDVRAGRWTGPTRGVVPDHVQCNLVVLPQQWADGFAQWCEANPSVAPVLARSELGSPRLPVLGEDIDLRTDLPSYRVFEHGEAVGTTPDLVDLWRDDLVAFAFGCSFSLEEAMRRAGVSLDYEARGFGGAIYQSTLETEAVGEYGGPVVVSMRPLPAEAVEHAIEVSRRHPWLHGAPLHAGDPSEIGIDLDRPLESFGEVRLADGEVPVFWACGVTTQRVVERARPDLAITHESAHMLVTDVPLTTTFELQGEPA
ncbi:putative hydro-lyase [Nocardioides endophyticus]|uniref:Hydro-lyase n=1 Tax=Nocardioides endophyticus TaxID=1353775 RepID=A0ABP8YU90_9ACTN